MNQEKYTLTWHSYSDHLKSMMKELMMNEDFSDVTLVTEDKKQIKAHINILSACSPVFRDILKKERNSNQIMYLRGIQFPEMESIMQFIYLGEATFYEERMDEFLAVAKSLEIKELCNTSPWEKDEPEVSSCDPVTSTENLKEETDVLSSHSKLEVQQERQRRVISGNVRNECDQCHKTYSGRGALYKHKQTVHQGVKYACDICDHQATQKSDLIKHIQSKHEGIRYACDQCGQQFTKKENLRTHIIRKMHYV